MGGMTEGEWLIDDLEAMVWQVAGDRHNWPRPLRPDYSFGPGSSLRKLRLLSFACCRRLEQAIRFSEQPSPLDSYEEEPSFPDTPELIEHLGEVRRRIQQRLNGFSRTRNDPPLNWNESISEMGLEAEECFWYALDMSVAIFPESAASWCIQGIDKVARRDVLSQWIIRNPNRKYSGVLLKRAEKASSLATSDEIRYQCSLLRDIFGNPFRPVAIDPAWLKWNDATIPRQAQAIYDERRFADLPILADALEEAGCTNADILEHCRGPGPHVRGCWVVDAMLGKA
jgi:hypothetical protein